MDIAVMVWATKQQNILVRIGSNTPIYYVHINLVLSLVLNYHGKISFTQGTRHLLFKKG